jgi:hypothetical protein
VMYRQCLQCGCLFLARVGQRKFCEPCREERHRAKNRRWKRAAKDHWNDDPELFEALEKRDHAALAKIMGY